MHPVIYLQINKHADVQYSERAESWGGGDAAKRKRQHGVINPKKNIIIDLGSVQDAVAMQLSNSFRP